MRKKHADLIIAWANGAAIQYRNDERAMWVDCDDPAWIEDYEYRIKPADLEKYYPVTRLSSGHLQRVYNGSVCPWPLLTVANAVLRDAIDAGQVVTREEFDRAIGDRDARDMAVAGAVLAEVNRTAGYFKGFVDVRLLHNLETIELEDIIDKVKA